MPADKVKISISITEHQALKALLGYFSGKVDEHQLADTLTVLAYTPRGDIGKFAPMLAEQLRHAIS